MDCNVPTSSHSGTPRYGLKIALEKSLLSFKLFEQIKCLTKSFGNVESITLANFVKILPRADKTLHIFAIENSSILSIIFRHRAWVFFPKIFSVHRKLISFLMLIPCQRIFVPLLSTYYPQLPKKSHFGCCSRLLQIQYPPLQSHMPLPTCNTFHTNGCTPCTFTYMLRPSLRLLWI